MYADRLHRVVREERRVLLEDQHVTGGVVEAQADDAIIAVVLDDGENTASEVDPEPTRRLL